MIVQLFIMLLVINIASCSSLFEDLGHPRFIESMNIYTSTNNIVEGDRIWLFYGNEKYEGRFANIKNLKFIEKKEDKIFYHYGFREMKHDWGLNKKILQGYCNYYFVVNAKTMMIIDWGFGEGNVKEYCRSTG